MSSFDTLSRGKKHHTNSEEKSEEIFKKNTGKKVYKDIKKREKILLIKPLRNIHQHKKTTTEEKVFRIQDEIRKFGNSLKKRQIGILVLVLFLSYVVYGVGFVLRTENMIRNIISSPEKYYSPKKIRETLYDLWQDYQILGLVADNSPIPIEPLTSYGKILKNTRLLVAQSENIKKMTNDILEWKNTSETKSIFPLLDELWEIAENGRDNIDTMIRSLASLTKPDQGILEKYTKYKHYLDTFLEKKPIWYDLLGDKKSTRILILNQNNDELRAGGGFPGTIFLVEFEEGKIKNISFHDIYEIDHSIEGYIAPPEGINQFRSLKYPQKPQEFRIRDANYYPTFSESAKKIQELASISKIGPVDLVIGINTSLLSDIIALTGPIKVGGISMKLRDDNISFILSMLVEAKEKTHGIPKGVISFLGETLIDTILEKKKTLALGKILWKNLEDGEIHIASPHAEIQRALDDIGIFDAWKNSEKDFVYPIFTSISNNKSDRIMTREIMIYQRDACIRDVTLTQKHGWNIAVETQIKKIAFDLGIVDRLPLLLPIQGSGDNKQYIRFILPKGSTVEPSGKIRLKKLNNHYGETIIDGYITTQAGKSSVLSFSYTLPKNLCGTETEFIKQAGLKNLTITVEENGKIVSEKIF